MDYLTANPGTNYYNSSQSDLYYPSYNTFNQHQHQTLQQQSHQASGMYQYHGYQNQYAAHQSTTYPVNHNNNNTNNSTDQFSYFNQLYSTQTLAQPLADTFQPSLHQHQHQHHHQARKRKSSSSSSSENSLNSSTVTKITRPAKAARLSSNPQAPAKLAKKGTKKSATTTTNDLNNNNLVSGFLDMSRDR